MTELDCERKADRTGADDQYARPDGIGSGHVRFPDLIELLMESDRKHTRVIAEDGRICYPIA